MSTQNRQKKLEGILRAEFKEAMKGKVRVTWHEDREIGPGVPDVSYIVLFRDGETGWLELKAIDPPGPRRPWKVTIEPSQHQWIELHHQRVPVHFLIAVGDMWWVVPGRFHEQISNGCDPKIGFPGFSFPKESASEILPLFLASFTDRERSE